MATYPVINKETGEQKDVKLSVHEWNQWLEDNPEWQRDWSDPSTAPNCGEIGEVYDKLKKSHPGWNDVLRKASKAPKSRVKPI
tara:strand:+ start:172 stop:420 length:249 start_codon:yes stop_codon:yes gene_type:complete